MRGAASSSALRRLSTRLAPLPTFRIGKSIRVAISGHSIGVFGLRVAEHVAGQVNLEADAWTSARPTIKK
jgi:hypothetical protein